VSVFFLIFVFLLRVVQLNDAAFDLSNGRVIDEVSCSYCFMNGY